MGRGGKTLARRQATHVYLWADGLYFNIRLEDPNNRKQCILVLMGATSEGKKELMTITDGYRESEQSWKELLLEAKTKGVNDGPEVCHRRWSTGILGGLGKGLSHDTLAALLGP